MSHKLIKFMAAGLLCCALPAFAQDEVAPTKPQKVLVPQTEPFPLAADDKGELFKAFGGETGIAAITDDFIVNVLADPRTHDFFVAVDLPKLKTGISTMLCQIVGGGCAYTGQTMKASHKDLGIRQEDFYAVVEALQKAMDKNHVPFQAQNKLLAVLAPMHRDMVTAP